MKYVEFKRRLTEGDIQPFYLITGDDAFVIRKAQENLRSLVKSFADFNLHIFTQGYKMSDIIAALRTLPLMGGRVVVEVSGYNLDSKELVEYLKRPSTDVVLVIIAPSISASKNVSALGKLATVVECDRLDEYTLQKWVIKRCADNGTTISEEAAARLVKYSERYMSRIEIEADKLSSYRMGGSITLQDVELLVTPSADFKIYELGDAIISGRGERTMSALRSLMEDTSGGYIISGLYSYFRRLLHVLICKDARVSEYLGVKEFAITASRRQAASISPKRLKLICDRFQAADYDFKSGKIPLDLAVETIVAQTVTEMNA